MTPVETPPAIELLRLAPSSIKYLFDKCPRCFWLKTRGITSSEKFEFGLAKQVDEGMKDYFDVAALRSVGIPAVEVLTKAKLTSRILETSPGVGIQISGFADRIARLESEDFAVIDFKLAAPRAKKDGSNPFTDQLMAYATAMEYPEKDDPRPVECGYTICFMPGPVPFAVSKDGANAAVKGFIQVDRVEMDRGRFLNRLDQIAAVAAQHNPPPAGEWCDTCRSLDAMLRYLREVEG